MKATTCPYTTEQLQELELRIMAYRYAYYVECEPLVPDALYDQLERATRPWLPSSSPVHQVGSDLASSYRIEHIAYAQQLRQGALHLFQP